MHLGPKRHAVRSRDHGVLAGVLALVIGAVAFVPSYIYFSAAGALEQVHYQDVTLLLGPDLPDPPPPPTDEVKGQWINILLMGSDTRVGANAAIGGANGSSTEMNNDTTILMHISADRTRIELISIPRDSVVRLPGCERSDGSSTYPETTRFNRAFYIGGMKGVVGDAAACTIKTVQSLTDIYISEYIVVDFVGVQNIINVLGGVPMCIPFDVSSPKAGLKLEAGPQILGGWAAVAWARARTMEFTSSADRKAFEAMYGPNGNDLYRIKRQQELVGKVFEVALSQNLFLHPTQLTDLFEAAADSMTVSPNMRELDFLIGLAWSLRDIDKANIVFTTVPTRTNPEDPNTLVFSSSADALFAAIRNDQPISGNSVADMSDAAPVPAPSSSTGTDPASGETIDILGACTVG